MPTPRDVLTMPAVVRSMLALLNVVDDAGALAAAVPDDPRRGPVRRAYGLRRSTAEAVLAARRGSDDRVFTTLDQVRAVDGVGPDTLHDLAVAVAGLRSSDRALALVNLAGDGVALGRALRADVRLTTPGEPTLRIPTRTLTAIVASRDEQPDGVFARLEDVRAVTGVGPRTMLALEDAFADDPPGPGGAVARARLAAALAGAMASSQYVVDPPTGRTNLPDAVERVAGAVGGQRADDLRGLWDTAVATAAVRPGEDLAGLLDGRSVAGAAMSPPAGLLDPGELPATPGQRWLRTDGAVVVHPVGDAVLAALTPDGAWDEIATVTDPLAIAPTATGVAVSTATGASLAGVDSSLRAVRVTATGGLTASLAGVPAPLDPTVPAADVPDDWDLPDRVAVPRSPGLLGPVGTSMVDPVADAIVVGRDIPVGDGGTVVGEGGAIGVGGDVLVGWEGPAGSGTGEPGGDGDSGDGGGILIGGPGVFVVRTVDVTVTGCTCLRRREIETWTATATPAGGTYAWSLDDPTLAEILGPADQPTVRVRGLDVGDLELTCRYDQGGASRTDTIGVAVIAQRFTPAGRPAAELAAHPLVQPAPSVRADPASVTHRAGDGDDPPLLVSLRGTLADALGEITGVEVLSTRQRRVLPRFALAGGDRHDDTTFEVRDLEVAAPGVAIVRVRATNPIGYVGTDTITVTTTVKPVVAGVVRDVAADLAAAIERGDDPAGIATIRDRLRRARETALQTAEVTATTPQRVRPPDPRVPGRERWSLAVEDDATSGSVTLSTPIEARDVGVQRRSGKLLTPTTRPNSFVALHGDYRGSALTWPRDGILLTPPGGPVALSYLDPCCDVVVPAATIRFEPAPGVQRIQPGGSVELQVVVDPDTVLNDPGTVAFTVDAHPAGASFRFEPAGPTPARRARFFTDTTGVYTFRASRQVAGAAGPWTYAVIDAQVVVDVETTAVVRRWGDHQPDDHRDRPLYRVVTEEAQPGADIRIEATTGRLGPVVQVTAACPGEIAFAAGPVARATLSDGSTLDTTLDVDPTTPARASGIVNAPGAIETIDLLGIRYRLLSRRAGDHVWIDVAVTAIVPDVPDLAVPPPTTPALPGGGTLLPGPSQVFVVGGGLTRPPPDPGTPPAHPLVNLLLRRRDLGAAVATHARTSLPNGVVTATLVNGNAHVDLPLYLTHGMGIPVPGTLAHDTRNATRARALAAYGMLNGKDAETVAREFGREVFGWGWSSTLDPSLCTYVDPDGSLDSDVLTACVEVRMPDGNRIAFEEVAPNTYHVRSEAEALVDDPDAALGLVLTRTPSGHDLEFVDRSTWRFDERGRISEMRDLRMDLPDRRLQPATWTWTDRRVEIADSSGRTTALEVSDGLVRAVETPEGERTTLEHEQRHLRRVRRPEAVTWTFDYDGDSLLTRVVPPEDDPTTLRHYPAGSPADVERSTARDFWGHVGILTQADRTLDIAYEPRSEVQAVTCRDPQGHRWRHRFTHRRGAADRTEYANRQEPDDWHRLLELEHRGDSKALDKRIDHRGAIEGWEWESRADRGLRRLMTRHSGPGVSRFTGLGPPSTKVDRVPGSDLVQTRTDGEGHATTLVHADDRQVARIEHPPVEVLDPDLVTRTKGLVEVRTHDDFGRLATVTSPHGVVTTYGYGGPRDPGGCGLPTSVTVGTADDARTEEYGYDVMGRRVTTVTPLGRLVRHDYDDLGRLEHVVDGTHVVTTEYDRQDRVERVTDEEDRVTTILRDGFGEVGATVNTMGDTRTLEMRDQVGNPVVEVREDGGRWEYRDIDALGRVRRLVPPSVARQGPDGLATPDVPARTTQYLDEPTMFAPTKDRVTRVVETLADEVRTTYVALDGRVVAIEDAREGRVRQVITSHDRRLLPVERWVREGGSKVATLEAWDHDAMGRLVTHTRGEVTVRKGRGRDDESLFEVELQPEQSDQERRASMVRRLDDHGRLVAVLDGRGVPVLTHDYDDTARTCLVRAADPSGRAELVDVRRITYDRRGEVVRREDLRSGDAHVYEVDDHMRLRTQVEPSGRRTTFDYDAMDRLSTTTSTVPAAAPIPSAAGAAATVAPAEPVTIVERIDYDRFGRVRRRGSDTTGVERFTYDTLGRLITERRSGLGGDVTAVDDIYYDVHGQETARWWGPGHLVRIDVDHPGRTVTEQLVVDGSPQTTRATTFDELGHPLSHTPENGPVRLRLRHDSGARPRTWELNGPPGRIATVEMEPRRGGRKPDAIEITTTSSGRTVTMGYDHDLRMVSVGDQGMLGDDPVEFVWNRAGMRLELRRPSDPDATTTMRHHRTGAMSLLRHRLGPERNQAFETRVDPDDVDRFGNPTRLRHLLLDESGDEVADERLLQTESHRFDDDNRLVESTYEGVVERALVADERTRLRRQFGYDAAGRLAAEVLRVLPDLDDPDEEVVEVVRRTFAGAAMATEERQVYVPGRPTPNIRRTVVTHDLRGRRATVTETLVTTAGTWARQTRYGYGLGEQPLTVRVLEKRGERLFAVMYTTRAHDHTGRLVNEIVQFYEDDTFGRQDDVDPPFLSGRFAVPSDFAGVPVAPLRSSGTTQRHYVHAGDQLVAVLDANGRPLQEFLTGPGTNQRLVERRRDGTVLDVHLDRRGTMLVLTDRDGEIADAPRQVGTYGEFIESRRFALHQGSWLLPEDELVQSARRLYDPTTGEFLSPDPRGLEARGTLYGFADGNPLAAGDARGEAAVSSLVIAGAVAWFVWECATWIGGGVTGDPAWETSPLSQIAHFAFERSLYGGPGSGHRTVRYEDGDDWRELIYGATTLLGLLLPLGGAFQALRGGAAFQAYRAALLVDAGANIALGAYEATRGGTVAGPAQVALGLLDLLSAARLRRIPRIRPSALTMDSSIADINEAAGLPRNLKWEWDFLEPGSRGETSPIGEIRIDLSLAAGRNELLVQTLRHEYVHHVLSPGSWTGRRIQMIRGGWKARSYWSKSTPFFRTVEEGLAESFGKWQWSQRDYAFRHAVYRADKTQFEEHAILGGGVVLVTPLTIYAGRLWAAKS